MAWVFRLPGIHFTYISITLYIATHRLDASVYCLIISSEDLQAAKVVVNTVHIMYLNTGNIKDIYDQL